MAQLDQLETELAQLKYSVERLQHVINCEREHRERLERAQLMALGNADARLAMTEGWFRTLLAGAATVLEFFPSPDKLDYWRCPKRAAEGEWASLVRDFWNPQVIAETDEPAPERSPESSPIDE